MDLNYSSKLTVAASPVGIMDCRLKVVCYNMDYTSEDVITASYLKGHNPDLIFLQEAKINAARYIAKVCNCKLECNKESSNEFNCILYKPDKFKFRWNANSNDRMCMTKLCVQLKNAEGDLSEEDILAVSCHMPKSSLTNEQRLANAKQFFETLNKIQLSIICPVIVGGDFNCIISQKSVETNFEIPLYEVTERRTNKAGKINKNNVCIDYFAYNNYDDKVSIKISDVRADNIDDTESHHDPLIATMTIITQPRFFNILSFNMNGSNSTKIWEYIGKLSPKPHLCFLHEVPQRHHVTDKFPYSHDVIFSEASIILALDKSKFSIERSDNANKFMIDTIEVNIVKMNFTICPSHGPVIIVSCHKIRDIKESDVKCLFETLNNEYSDKYSILVAGDFNIYNIIDPGLGDIKYYEQFTIMTYEPTIHRAVNGGLDDACIDFFAYKTNADNSIIFQNFSNNSEMILECPENLVMLKHGQCYVNTKIPFWTEINRISLHDLL